MAEQAYTPDRITVTALATEEVSATHATLYVRIQGTSFFSGQMALTRAREVAQFVAALRELGLTDDDIQLQGVTASESSGILTRTSSALYDLKVQCKPLDRLAELLGAISAQKNIQLQRLQWGYDALDTLRETLQDRCLTELNRRARRIAAGLGVTLLGVHRHEEQWYYPESDGWVKFGYTTSLMKDSSKSSMRRADLGMNTTHVEKIRLQTEVAFRVSGFGASV